MDLDCGGESVGGVMQSEEEMGREKPSGAGAVNHNHYTTNKFACALYISNDRLVKKTNESFVVACKDESGAQVTWIGPKGPLGAKSQPPVLTSSLGTYIKFDPARSGDSGTYTCRSATGDTKEFHLTVEAALTLLADSVQEGLENTDIVLRCEASGGTITWTIDGELIKDDKKYRQIGDGLVVVKATRNDSKVYGCKAFKSSTGEVRDSNITLKVQHKPTPVYAKHVVVWSYLNGTANLICEVAAEPPPKFSWSRKQNKNQLSGKIHNETSYRSILQIKVDKNSFGEYKCTAKNRLGEEDMYFSLEQGSKPDRPEFLELRGANADLLDLGIHGPNLTNRTIPKGMEPNGFFVEYRPYKTMESWQNQEFDTSSDNSYPLRTLEANTEYEVKAATRNKAGISEFTNSSIFKTLASQSDSLYFATPSYLIVNFLGIITLVHVLRW